MERFTAASIGKRIAMYRRNVGMTADELARELRPDVTGNAITKLENGHRAQVSPALVVDIAHVLGVSPLALLFPLEDPEAEIVLNGQVYAMRDVGQWLFGMSTTDPVTETFRMLVATDRASLLARSRLESAAEEAARNRARSEVADERDREVYLSGVLDSVRRILRLKTDGVADGEHQAKA